MQLIPDTLSYVQQAQWRRSGGRRACESCLRGRFGTFQRDGGRGVAQWGCGLRITAELGMGHLQGALRAAAQLRGLRSDRLIFRHLGGGLGGVGPGIMGGAEIWCLWRSLGPVWSPKPPGTALGGRGHSGGAIRILGLERVA